MTGEGHWFPKLQHLWPFVVEKVAVHNTGISLLIDKCVGYFKSPDRASRLDQRLNVPVHGQTRAHFHGNQLNVTNLLLACQEARLYLQQY